MPARSNLLARLALFMASAAVLAPTVARAQVRPLPDAMETTRGLAMGMGSRSSGVGVNALAYNPANLGLGRVYHVDASAGYESTTQRITLQSTVIDSYSGPVAMGISYRALINEGATGYGGMEGRAGFGVALAESFAIGLSGRYLSVNAAGAANAGQKPLVENFNVDASIRFTPLPGFHLAALAYNLIDYGPSWDGVQYMPRTFGGSMSYTIDGVFTLGGDFTIDTLSAPADVRRDVAVTGGGAAEWLAAGVVPLRVGYFYDNLRGLHVVTGGIGYVDPHFAIEGSFRQEAYGGSGTTVFAGFRYFVQ